MRHLSWLAVTAAFLAGGCKSPCGGGACSSGGPLFHPPAARFSQSEKILSCDDGCENGECTSSGYLTLAKYWPSLDGWATEMTAKKCAKKELLRQQWQSKTYLPSDFKRGYLQAFVDVANGESGDVPAVPPPRYWNTAYRSAKGRLAADHWFDGYRKGAADAAVKLCSLRQIASSHDWMADRPDDISPDCATGNCPTGIPGMSPPMAMPPQPLPGQHPGLLQQTGPGQYPVAGPPQMPVQSPGPYPAPVQRPLLPQPQPHHPQPHESPARQPQAYQPLPPPGPASRQPLPHPPTPPENIGPRPQSAAPLRPGAGPAAGPGYAAPTQQPPFPQTLAPQAPTAAIQRDPAAAGSIADPRQNPAARASNATPGYAPSTGTSPGGGLPTQLSNQKLGPPPGLFNDPPVWRTRPGHSPLPQQ